MMPGGRLGDREYFISHAPQCVVGETVLAFGWRVGSELWAAGGEEYFFRAGNHHARLDARIRSVLTDLTREGAQ
jgi:hypothetical protein